MVILGGLELVAAGYLLREHNKHKKEREQAEAEEARLRHERRRRRKNDNSPDRPGRPDRPDRTDRPGRSDTKYDYVPPSAMKPSSAGSNLAAPLGPPGRTSSQPPPGFAPPAYSPPKPYPQPQAYGVPTQPPPQQGYGYGQYPPGPPPQQPYPQNPGLAGDYYNPENNFGPGSSRPRAPEPEQRRNSDPPYPVGVAELSADGPWMHDMHRTAHQTPHVRFNFPDSLPQPGDETRSPPPAYRP